MRLIFCNEAWRRADCFSSTVRRDEGMEKDGERGWEDVDKRGDLGKGQRGVKERGQGRREEIERPAELE